MNKKTDAASSGEPFDNAVAYLKYLKSIGIEYVEPARTAENAATKEIASLAEEVAGCKSCVLHQTRTQTVFGAGSPSAGIMFVGEAPGADEDKQGEPFVGRAGKLLTKMIEAIGFRRKDVYIANVLKCRPPQNRDPRPEEVAACEHFLVRQIKLIKPLVICALGAHAAKTLLQTDDSIGKLRGRFFDYHGVPLIPTYHPAFLLRSSQSKKAAWEDLQKLRDRYHELKG